MKCFLSKQQSAAAVLLAVSMSLVAACAADPAPKDAGSSERFRQLDESEAWQRMSRPTPPLPAWALTLADTLPRTTAAQIDLDHLHRTANPLGPVLSARVRRAVADANRCQYSKAIAESDLERAGVDNPSLDPSDPTDVERVAVEFARKLTLSASSITDEEAAAMLAALGPDDAVALVHTVAHANFQDRIFLALGLVTDPSGALPPCTVGPIEDRPTSPALRASSSSNESDQSQATLPSQSTDMAELRTRLEQQKARQARIPPADAARLARLPRPDRERAGNSAWGRISMGYQPELTRAWYRTMGAFADEAQLDLVFANSIFWVITRSTDCFY